MIDKELKILAEWAIPYNSNCPQKKARIDYRRERLIEKIKIIYANTNSDPLRKDISEVSE